jgi:hypothetical protein
LGQEKAPFCGKQGGKSNKMFNVQSGRFNQAASPRNLSGTEIEL